MKRALPAKIAFGVLLLVVPAAADAPADQYDPFDRTDVAITDHFTSLTWVRAVQRTAFTTEKDAETYCKNIGAFVPTVKDLLTIVDEEPHQEYEGRSIVTKMIDAYAFPDTPVDAAYWTSTPAGANAHWTVDFRTGVTAKVSEPSTGAYVRCVK
jgi:hypothetical protein